MNGGVRCKCHCNSVPLVHGGACGKLIQYRVHGGAWCMEVHGAWRRMVHAGAWCMEAH